MSADLFAMHHPIVDLALAWGVVNLLGVLWLAGLRRKCDEVPLRRFRRVTLRRLQHDFASDAIDLGFTPRFFRCFDCGHRLADAAPGVIEISEVRMGSSQIR